MNRELINRTLEKVEFPLGLFEMTNFSNEEADYPLDLLSTKPKKKYLVHVLPKDKTPKSEAAEDWIRIQCFPGCKTGTTKLEATAKLVEDLNRTALKLLESAAQDHNYCQYNSEESDGYNQALIKLTSLGCTKFVEISNGIIEKGHYLVGLDTRQKMGVYCNPCVMPIREDIEVILNPVTNEYMAMINYGMAILENSKIHIVQYNPNI